MSKSDCVNKTEESSSSTRWLANNNGKRNDIWTSTNYNEERQRIREFWLQLSEVDRRSLVKVEKEAVLRKMKEQQRHSCNCSVCGKKRNAIEEELEVLYDTYYEELEQYAYRQQHKYTTVIQCKKKSNRNSTIEQEDSLKLLEFKNTLTVKGSIITVADDLLKNDGKKFLDMMERLAERKLLKESQSLSNSDDEEEQEGSEKDKEESKQKDNESDDDAEEEDCVTEEQRMEEGRKMFQVFAARMFEQRVLTAYREKVAQDRQQRLIEELEEEDRQRREREQRKQLEKEKKRDKKRQIKAQQEKERLEIENKRKQEELAAKADRERKLKMERQIKEQERLKREEERLQKERDRLRKEDEKKKRRLKGEQDKEKKRLEEEQRQQKLKEDEERKKKETVQVIQAATSNAATAAVSAIKHNDDAVSHSVSSPKSNYQGHHILTDANTVVTPRGHHRTASAGPIGSPVHVSTLEPYQNYIATNESESQYSFFSDFLFDQPTTRRDHQESRNKNSRRVSSDGSSSSRRWSNGWTPLTTLSDNVHGKLFGDVLTTDRNTLILERAKYAYLKLDELAQTQYFMIPHFHTLDQLYHMMRDLFYDISIETRELYDILTYPANTTEFKCYYNQHQQCYLVQYGNSPSRSNSSSLLPTSMNSPLPSFTQLPTFSNS